jgi:hypothetical protein
MANKKSRSLTLRHLAEDLLHSLIELDVIRESDLADLATSLVRQWITYDGNATLFLGERQLYLVLDKTLLGKPCLIPEPALPGWTKGLLRDWKIQPEDLSEVFDQLNRGQSAEVVNADELPLRLWVDPRQRSKGVEPLAAEPDRPAPQRDYHKIAADVVEQQFGEQLDETEQEELACSVAQQWQRYQGHAGLFVGGELLAMTLTEQEGGGCCAQAGYVRADLEPLLCSLGFAPEAIPEVVARINLGQEVEFHNPAGVRSCLWYDPQARRIHVRPLEPMQPGTQGKPSVLFCPKCSAVLDPWPVAGRQPPCPCCGHAASEPLE